MDSMMIGAGRVGNHVSRFDTVALHRAPLHAVAGATTRPAAADQVV